MQKYKNLDIQRIHFPDKFTVANAHTSKQHIVTSDICFISSGLYECRRQNSTTSLWWGVCCATWKYLCQPIAAHPQQHVTPSLHSVM